MLCDRVRAQISVGLDGELSELEQAMVGSHLSWCGSCRAFEADVTTFTRMVRSAERERMETPVVIRRPRRYAALRVPASVAAAMALVVVGVASQVAAFQPRDATRASVSRYPTQEQIRYEQRLLKIASGEPVQGSRANSL
jgi:predicted anti-sigma-YlaC factor YlaD